MWAFYSITLWGRGSPQGCVLGPLFFALLVHDCTADSGTNQLIKFACDNTDVGLISDDVDTAYRAEVEQLMNKGKGTNLS